MATHNIKDYGKELLSSSKREYSDLEQATGRAVTESAGACSYYSISTGMQTGTPPGCTIFDLRVKIYIVSESVVYTQYSVQKCLIDSLSVLFEVGDARSCGRGSLARSRSLTG